ncbi:MAG: glycoside hydrolase family 88 protein [Saprospiraceae bacterium]
MQKIIITSSLILFIVSSFFAQNALEKPVILEKMRLANSYFMEKWPDTSEPIINDKKRPSNIWTRAVYYEGLMALHTIDPQPAYYDYAVSWGEAHQWKFRGNRIYTRDADHQCAGQTYIDLYLIDPKPERIKNIKLAIDSMMATDKIDDWHWIDAIQMGLPVFAKLGKIYKNDAYYKRGFAMYNFAKKKHGDKGLYNKKDKLWWRDADFDPPYKEPNGEDCYWSRGNGWIVMALAKYLDITPTDAPYRKVMKRDLKRMAKALAKVQRIDGFWNVSLHDPTNFGGKETSGTAMFTYAMAWGINNGILKSKKYKPIVEKAWTAMVNEALHPNGFLGYMQSTGKEPKDGQPLSYDKIPNFEDYGLGAFLLAGSEVYKME